MDIKTIDNKKYVSIDNMIDLFWVMDRDICEIARELRRWDIKPNRAVEQVDRLRTLGIDIARKLNKEGGESGDKS